MPQRVCPSAMRDRVVVEGLGELLALECALWQQRRKSAAEGLAVVVEVLAVLQTKAS